MSRIEVLSAGPSVTLQDAGRAGMAAFGLSAGGAMDPLALAEARALLGAAFDGCAIEMGQMGGRFCADADLVIALTGAAMKVNLDGQALAWGQSHHWPAGAVLEVGAATGGAYGYLSVAGTWDVPVRYGAKRTHIQAGIGAPLAAGDVLTVVAAKAEAGLGLPAREAPPEVIRVIPSVQSHWFGDQGRDWLQGTVFIKTAKASRMGAALAFGRQGVQSDHGLSVTSEIVSLGDIQITGDGTPYVLMREAQTTGGYPRIATVISADLPAFAQLPSGAQVRLRFVTVPEALAARAAQNDWAKGLRGKVRPVVRRLETMHDLLSYSLVSGVVSATDPEGWE